jgi:phage tail sheath gpL-like
MPIAFEAIPANQLVPLFYAEVTPAFAPFNSSLKLLLIGHEQTGRPGAYNVPTRLSASETDRLYGVGSMLAEMYRMVRLNAPFVEVWGVATEPGAGAAAAVGSITVSTAPSTARSGMLSFLVAGHRIAISVRPTDTQATVAARLVSTMATRYRLPLTAAIDGVDDTKVNLTAKWAGYSGNYIDFVARPYGADNNLASQLLTFVQPAGGAGYGGVGAALAAIGDQAFDVICIGNSAGTGTLNALQDFFDHTSGRWSPSQQLYGHGIIAQRADFSTLTTLGATRNDPHVTILGTGWSPQPIWNWAAALAAHMTQHWAAPPELSRPLQSLELKGIMPPVSMAHWFDQTERHQLLEQGISTWRADQDRTVRLDRVVTTYKTNVWGDPDASWRDAVTLFQAQYFVRRMRAAITGTFPRAALTTEDVNISGFASPGKIQDLLIHEYKALAAEGLVENPNLFAAGLVVERNAVDANRVDIMMRPDVVNQLRIVAAVVETHLELDEARLALAL